MNDKEFYDYKYWREVQRNQLTISSNIYLSFSVAIIGYSLNLVLTHQKFDNNNCLKILFLIGILVHLISIIFYVFLTENKLKDYKKTSELIKEGKNSNEVISITDSIGKKTWKLYNCQKCFFIIGIIIMSILFLLTIFN